MTMTITVREYPGFDVEIGEVSLAKSEDVRVAKVQVYELTFSLPIGARERFEADLERYAREELTGCSVEGQTITSTFRITWHLVNRIEQWVLAWLRQAHVA